MISIYRNSSVLYHMILLWVFLITISCTDSKDPLKEASKSAKEEARQRLVDIEPIRRNDFPVELIINGKIESRHRLSMILDQGGYIAKLSIYNGKLVHQGDTLAVIENAHQKIQWQKAKLVLKEAENELSSLMLGFGGTADDTTSVDKEIFKNLKVNCGFTRALLDVKLAQLNYQNTFIIAPFSGVIANLGYQILEYANSGSSLCELINNEDYIVEFKVTENELSKISLGQPVKLQPIHDENALIGGRIIEINPLVDKQSLIQVIAKIYPYPQTIYTGMNAIITIEKKIPNCLSIPKKAMVLRNDKKVVFTYKQGKAFWNYIETSAENSKRYLVSNGLREGDSVIIDGNLNLAHQVDVLIKK